MFELHNQYGRVVRVAPNELTFVGPAAWNEIYGQKRHGQKELTKDPKYYSGMGEPTLLHSNQEQHAHLRKLLAHGFSDTSLRKQEVVIQKYLNVLMSSLRHQSQDGQAILDLKEWTNVSHVDLRITVVSWADLDLQFFIFDVIGYLGMARTRLFDRAVTKSDDTLSVRAVFRLSSDAQPSHLDRTHPYARQIHGFYASSAASPNIHQASVLALRHRCESALQSEDHTSNQQGKLQSFPYLHRKLA
jgi:hypothetical protein